jgi:pre-mRNA-splicing factor ATP-dependent RNA helicase DHX38/PRP16
MINVQELPVFKAKNEIIQAIKKNKVTIVVGETGCGRTTQIPNFIYESGLVNGGIVGITQPRRIAAISVAEFVAKQLGSRLGELVGYQIRFDDQTFDHTKIKFMADGILLRELQIDPDLKKYSVIMIDEAHERSTNIDFILGLLKDLLKRRDDLKVIMTSGTIDEKSFSLFLGRTDRQCCRPDLSSRNNIFRI